MCVSLCIHESLRINRVSEEISFRENLTKSVAKTVFAFCKKGTIVRVSQVCETAEVSKKRVSRNTKFAKIMKMLGITETIFTFLGGGDERKRKEGDVCSKQMEVAVFR
jgi:hypothetical protein